MSEQVRAARDVAARDVEGLRSTLNPLSEHRQTHPPVARWESRYRYAVITADVLTVALVVIAVGAVMSMRHTAFGPLSLA